MNKRDFPKIHFYDQDFVDVYDKTWSWLQDFWFNPETETADLNGLFIYPHSQNPVVDQMESIFRPFLVYSNKIMLQIPTLTSSINNKKKAVQFAGSTAFKSRGSSPEGKSKLWGFHFFLGRV